MGGKKGKGGEKERHADKRKDTQENKKRVRGGRWEKHAHRKTRR